MIGITPRRFAQARFQALTGPRYDEDWDGVHDLRPVFPARQLAEIVCAHHPDKLIARPAVLRLFDHINGVARAKFLLERYRLHLARQV